MRIKFTLLVLLLLFTVAPSAVAADAAGRKVLIVLIFDEGCKLWCQKVRPMMGELKKEFGDQIEVAEIDASAKTLKDAEAKARSLGIFPFLRDSAEWVPIVGVFSPDRKLIKELVGPKQKDTYVLAVKKALGI